MQRRSIILAVGATLVLLSGVVYVVMAVQQIGANDLSLSFEEMEQRRMALGMDRPLFEQFMPFIVPFLLGAGLISLFFMTRMKGTLEEEESRLGRMLSLYLILLLTIHLLLVVIYLVGAPQLISAFPGMPAWAIYAAITTGLVNGVGILAVWNWRRWGLYLLIMAAVGMLVVNLNAEMPLFFAWGGLVAVILLVVLLRPVWGKMR